MIELLVVITFLILAALFYRRAHHFFTHYRIVVRTGSYWPDNRYTEPEVKSGTKVYVARGWRQQKLFVDGCDPRQEEYPVELARVIALAKQQRSALNAARKTIKT